MTIDNDGANYGPEEGELVVCTITEVKQNGAYVSINGYDNINGFIFIGSSSCSATIIAISISN